MNSLIHVFARARPILAISSNKKSYRFVEAV